MDSKREGKRGLFYFRVSWMIRAISAFSTGGGLMHAASMDHGAIEKWANGQMGKYKNGKMEKWKNGKIKQ